MNVFRWKNCYADITASKHGASIQSYFDDVVRPALRTLEDQISALCHSDEPGAPFMHADATLVLHEAKMAFALSIQSVWERQLRSYLSGCAYHLRPHDNLIPEVERATWPRLRALFNELREIGLEAFSSFPLLDKLHWLGNACRHGDGPSAIELASRYPELWPALSSFPMPDGTLHTMPLTVARIEISVDHLCEFVGAIVAFWADALYIYNESIQPKDLSLESWLVRARSERIWAPLAVVGSPV